MGNVGLDLEQRDALGEMSNISMGSSATALSALLMNCRVEITTPQVEVIRRSEALDDYDHTCILVHINYIKGLEGSNILLLKEEDVMRITDMMMGGDGSTVAGDMTELHLSAVSEAMNQMMGSAATALAKLLNRSIDISPPKTEHIDVDSIKIFEKLFASPEKDMVKVTFKLTIGDCIDSSMVQLYPLELARQLVEYFYGR